MAYTTIDDPSAHFQATIYTGNGSDGYSITNSGNSDLQPDLLWFKNRNSTQIHQVFDTTRGIASSLRTNDTDAQDTDSPNDRLTAINSDGFTLGDDGNPNTNTNTYVCWQWKANGGTTSSNTSGDITSTVQANTTAGFSIVKYTGSGTDNDSVGHGLGIAPEMIILKKYDDTDSWMVFHHKLTAGSELKLDTSDAQADDASNATWGDNHPGNISSTVFEIGYAGDANASGSTYIAYCFKSIQGYSKFGSYEGNSDADGAFIYTGFKPAFVLARNISAGQSWWLFDNARTPYNGGDVRLRPDRDTAEYSGSKIDFVSNGFKWRDGDNAYNYSGNTFIYMAFAHQPFVTSGGVPCTAK